MAFDKFLKNRMEERPFVAFSVDIVNDLSVKLIPKLSDFSF
jgi:hypothetical protein